MSLTKELVIHREWCKGCGICVAFCPKQHLVLVHEKVEETPENPCILCGQCEMRCPDYAIYIREQEKEEGESQWVKSF